MHRVYAAALMAAAILTHPAPAQEGVRDRSSDSDIDTLYPIRHGL
ncbi:MAG TPA: hypothetical protein VFO40_22475 [Chthoniobacterales bacterium]|nr:hypothetical protein [Chthoniobacterales bacterium]